MRSSTNKECSWVQRSTGAFRDAKQSEVRYAVIGGQGAHYSVGIAHRTDGHLTEGGIRCVSPTIVNDKIACSVFGSAVNLTAKGKLTPPTPLTHRLLLTEGEFSIEIAPLS